MKLKVYLSAVTIIVTSTGILYAASGDLTVNGTINAGAGGIKFSDGSTQTSAKKLIWEHTVTGSAVQNVTIPGLDGNGDGGYEFEFIVFNNSGSNAEYRLYVENDQVNSSYVSMRHFYSGSEGDFGDQPYFADWLNNGGRFVSTGSFILSPNGYFTALIKTGRYHAPGYYQVIESTIFKKAPISNLTRIDLVANLADGIGINSRFRLWKKN